MKLKIKHDGKELYSDILLATSFSERLIGLMFKERPPKGSNGLLIDPCNSIHTCFMRYPIDVIFLDASNKIIKIIYRLKPWRFTLIYLGAQKTLEIPSGDLKSPLKVGDVLEVSYV
jgi:uncharacterized membrane protein (UPF0127 family)